MNAPQPASDLAAVPPSGHRGWRFWTSSIGPWLIGAWAAWAFVHPELTSAGMRAAGVFWGIAPITALLLVLLCATLGVQWLGLNERFRARVLWVGGATVALIATYLLWCRVTGRVSPAEIWVETHAKLGERGVPRTGPQTAILVLGSTFALLALYSPLRKRTVACIGGMVVALSILVFGFIAGMAFVAGNPLGVSSGWLPPMTQGMISLCAYSLLLLLTPVVINRLRQWFFGANDAGDGQSRIPGEERLVIALMAGLTVIATGTCIYSLRIRTHQQQVRSLETVVTLTDLKLREVTQWRRERLADANTLMYLPALSEIARGTVLDRAAASGLNEWLQKIGTDYGYTKIIVFNAAGESVAAFPAGARADAPGLQAGLAALQGASGVVELPPYLTDPDQVRWALLAPLRESGGTKLAGAVWLQTDPARSIFPSLKWWPGDYQTGQTVLWFRAGDRMTAMGGVREAPGVTRDRTLPFAETRDISRMPADSLFARVLRGEYRAAEGVDHHGVPIFGYGIQVPDSPWLLTTRVDSREVYEPLRRDARSLAAAAVGLLGIAGFATSWLWRQRQANLVRERETAELARKRSSARFGMVMQGANDIILLLDEELRIEDANRQAVETYGWSKEELVGMSARQLRTDDEATAFDDVTSRAKAAVGATYETIHRRKDGTTLPVEVSSRFVEIEGRHQWLSIIRDITERRRAQETLERFNSELEQQVEQRTAELAARNNETQRLLDAMPDTVLLCDEHGTLLSARSVRYPAVVGLVTGRPVPGTLPMVDAAVREIVGLMHAATLATGQTEVREFERPLEPGRTFWLEARATAIGSRVLIILREISERKRHDLGVLANLEREKQLSEMKSQFISVASHEFRTPLAAAVGSLELLERHASKLTEAKRVELITRIQRSLGRLTSIMDDVLQLSRADSGRIKVQRMEIDLVRFVEDIVRDVETGDRQQHHFAFQAPGGPCVVPADTKLLHHILTNLVSNAVRYSPAGTAVAVTLEIGATAFALTVADDGIGIPAAERDRIFEPFARGSNVGQIAGTGLGLNIVKRYTELMGGRIELLASARGAVFRVTLPFNQEPV